MAAAAAAGAVQAVPQQVQQVPQPQQPPQASSSRLLQVAKDVFAGTCGGISVTLVGHPFDTIKVRLQTQPMDKPIYGERHGGGGCRSGQAGGSCLVVRLLLRCVFMN
jgi:hypothetical protein